jgi:glycosyltransferase involved in cell wall biosynthesis
MQLSVIIPCFNGADTIATQLEALARQRWQEPWEVIVADNGSTDGSVAIVNQYQARLPSLRVVDASARRGQPYALNIGAQAATGESLAFSDADDEVGPGWLAAMGEALSRYDFVACRVDTTKLNPAWSHGSRGNFQQNGLIPYRYPPYLPHAGGSTLGVKRAIHIAVGGFDESLPYLHDTDYCWRIQRAGTTLHFVPDAILHYRYRDTLRGIYRQARDWGEYNVILYKRYRPVGMPPLTWKDGIRGWVTLLRQLPSIRSKMGRAAWLWHCAWRVGRCQACIKHRVVAF